MKTSGLMKGIEIDGICQRKMEWNRRYCSV